MKVSDLKNRVKLANNSGADILISIHLNKIDGEKYWGWQTFYKKSNAESRQLAESIQSSIFNTIKKENKREALAISNKYLIDNIKIPMVIVECGFLSNEEETNLLQTEDYQGKLADGILAGIIKYFNDGVARNEVNPNY